MGGGGGKAPTSTTVTQTNIPEWAKPYAMDILGRATALSTSPYTPYSGERVAGFTPMQEQAFASAAGMKPSEYIGQAGTAAGDAVAGSMGMMGKYQQGMTDPGEAAKYMSPYIQNVLDVQKQQAIRDYSRQLPQLGGAAARAGGLGGSRAALMQAEGQRNLQNQLQGIQTTGMQSAWDQARAAQMKGYDLGMQGYGQALQGAGILGNLGATEFGQRMGITEMQGRYGEAQRQLEQQKKDIQYQNFTEERDDPYKKIGFASDILRGLPSGNSTSSTYGGGTSPLGQLTGIGGLFYGMSKGG